MALGYSTGASRWCYNNLPPQTTSPLQPPKSFNFPLTPSGLPVGLLRLPGPLTRPEILLLYNHFAQHTLPNLYGRTPLPSCHSLASLLKNLQKRLQMMKTNSSVGQKGVTSCQLSFPTLRQHSPLQLDCLVIGPRISWLMFTSILDFHSCLLPNLKCPIFLQIMTFFSFSNAGRHRKGNPM